MEKQKMIEGVLLSFIGSMTQYERTGATMQEKVWNYVKKHQMLQEGDRVIVGISGGADSVALFYLLKEFRKRLPFAFCAVHVNHNIRGEEARRDAQFVKELCENNQVDFFEYSYNVRELAAKNGIGEEEAGREVRLQAFASQMEIWKGNKIALAHHKNDLAETMLHHLCRGTGLKGLCGILPVQGNKIRPLLCLERREIEHYLSENHYLYVSDSTNECDKYTRNRIRNEIIPSLENKINGKAVEHMADAAEHIRLADEYLARQAGSLLDKHEDPEESSGLLEGFFLEERILQEYAILQWIQQICGKRKDVTSVHVEQICLLGNKQVGKYVELPGNYQVVRNYRGITIQRNRVRTDSENCYLEKYNLGSGSIDQKTELEKDFQQNLIQKLDENRSKQVIALGNGKVTCRIFSFSHQEIPEKTYTKWLNYDKITKLVQFRTRKPGDYLVVNHRGGRKKLKDYFIDCKIPREKRGEIWLLAMGSEILWVVGYRISEAYKVTEDTQQILEVTYEGGYEDAR